MEISIHFSEEELNDLEIIGVSVANMSDSVLRSACGVMHGLMALRHDAAISGAMRWPNSQEYPLSFRCEISDC